MDPNTAGQQGRGSPGADQTPPDKQSRTVMHTGTSRGVDQGQPTRGYPAGDQTAPTKKQGRTPEMGTQAKRGYTDASDPGITATRVASYNRSAGGPPPVTSPKR